ncbi:MAG: zinc-ribbon domain-containing protein [Firmicutes bacterium]|nr:zinc-ribbon domain-containing protein [Bacillota bacterium]
MVYCKHCGSKINDGERFCRKCGKPVSFTNGNPRESRQMESPNNRQDNRQDTRQDNRPSNTPNNRPVSPQIRNMNYTPNPASRPAGNTTGNRPGNMTGNPNGNMAGNPAGAKADFWKSAGGKAVIAGIVIVLIGLAVAIGLVAASKIKDAAAPPADYAEETSQNENQTPESAVNSQESSVSSPEASANSPESSVSSPESSANSPEASVSSSESSDLSIEQSEASEATELSEASTESVQTEESSKAEEQPADTDSSASEPEAAVLTEVSVVIVGTSSSSELDESSLGLDHSAAMICDGTLENAWCEGVSGYGEGEWVKAEFGAASAISSMDIYAGYHKSSQLYYENSRPQELLLVFEGPDGSTTSESVMLEDVFSPQHIVFEQIHYATNVTIYIQSTYHGSVFDDTLITEVNFYMSVEAELDNSAFVKVKDYIPDIETLLMYATDQNFTGKVIYQFTDAYLRYGTVKKLAYAQEILKEEGYKIRIWDAFRPVSAQYVLWEVCPDPVYVANPLTGYSSHSRGNTVDITIVTLSGEEVEMPTGFDDFSYLADRDYTDCTDAGAANARMLEEAMMEAGFEPYYGEWWHFSDYDDYPVEDEFEPPLALF